MAEPRTRWVYGTITDNNDKPVINGEIKSVATVGTSYGNERVMIDRVSSVMTDATEDLTPAEAVQKKKPGKFRIKLVCTDDLSNVVKHKLAFPVTDSGAADDTHSLTFLLPYDDGSDLEIGDAILISADPATFPATLGAFVDGRIATALEDFDGGGSGGTTNHSALTNLNADDHPQYFNQSRGDARFERLANKNAANGYAGLDGSGKVVAAQLPSYVDDILEYATVSAFPATGETGKIYVATTGADANKEYRWSGSVYVELVSSPGTTDNVPEGATNKYFTAARVWATVLTGIVFTANAAITATDSILTAFGKLQAQITALIAGKADKSIRRTVSTTSDTVAASDNQNFILCTNGSATTLTVPTGLSTALGANEVFAVGIVAGAGAVTPSASGVTITNVNSHTKIKANGSGALVATGANSYRLVGETE